MTEKRVRGILTIIGVALMLRFILLGLSLYFLGQESLIVSDAPRFLKAAQALADGHGFTLGDAPYMPSAFFPPLFFMLFGSSLAIFQSFIPALFLHIILGGAVIPYVVWKISGFLTERNGIRLLAAGFAAFEPQMILWSIVPTTEILAGSLVLVSSYFFLKFLHSGVTKDAAYAGLFLGLSTLTRPHGQFLFIIAAIFLVVLKYIRQKSIRQILWKHIFSFSFMFLLILSPWLARNFYQFGKLSVATTGLRNVYSDFATSVLTYDTNGNFGEVRQKLYEDLAKKYGVTSSEIRQDPKWGPVLAKEGLKIIVGHPTATLGVFAITLNAFFTQDLYLYYFEHFHILPSSGVNFSPSVVLLKEGPWQLFQKITSYLGLVAFVPIIGRLFWILLFFSAVCGLRVLARQGGMKRTAGIVCAAIILYYAAVNSVGAFSDQGRLRYPANPHLFLLGSVGIMACMRKLKFFKNDDE